MPFLLLIVSFCVCVCVTILIVYLYDLDAVDGHCPSWFIGTVLLLTNTAEQMPWSAEKCTYLKANSENTYYTTLPSIRL